MLTAGLSYRHPWTQLDPAATVSKPHTSEPAWKPREFKLGRATEYSSTNRSSERRRFKRGQLEKLVVYERGLSFERPALREDFE